MHELLTLKEASGWATNFLQREVSESNIAYLLQYGRIKKYSDPPNTLINLTELEAYYAKHVQQNRLSWQKKFGKEVNWNLSFEEHKEKDRTKHVHRLHPYKGKFIPQLVEYFLDTQTDEHKKGIYFQAGDIVLDPFAGSGTTLVQAHEMGIHAIGVDVSSFNCMVAASKLGDYDLPRLEREVAGIKEELREFTQKSRIPDFEQELLEELSHFNKRYFPSPDFKYQLQQGAIEESSWAHEKEKTFLSIYERLIDKYQIELNNMQGSSFLDQWYMAHVRREIDFVFRHIHKIEKGAHKKLLAILLSRTIRSCRATAHFDLATLKSPQVQTYYCWKHKKICKPLFSIRSWFSRYATDTFRRLSAYNALKTDAYFAMLQGDARHVDIAQAVENQHKALGALVGKQKIKGIFTSPPYVGQIDYHEQHAYAYDLFGFARHDDQEIGPLYKGKGVAARQEYLTGIAQVLKNARKYLVNDFDVFLVANDQYNLYPKIAALASMRIVNRYERPVLHRTERDKTPYAESIFHLKAK